MFKSVVFSSKSGGVVVDVGHVLLAIASVFLGAALGYLQSNPAVTLIVALGAWSTAKPMLIGAALAGGLAVVNQARQSFLKAATPGGGVPAPVLSNVTTPPNVRGNQPPHPPAAARRSLLSWYHDIRDYGASPISSAAVNTAAIQSAASAVAAAGGGEVFVPAGTYLINPSTILLPTNVSLVGGFVAGCFALASLSLPLTGCHLSPQAVSSIVSTIGDLIGYVSSFASVAQSVWPTVLALVPADKQAKASQDFSVALATLNTANAVLVDVKSGVPADGGGVNAGAAVQAVKDATARVQALVDQYSALGKGDAGPVAAQLGGPFAEMRRQSAAIVSWR